MKKNFFALVTLVLLSSVLMFLGCKKEGNSELTKKEIDSNAFMKIDGEDCLIYLSDSQIDSVGTEHNRLLKIGIENYIFNTELTLRKAMKIAYDENGYPMHSDEEFAEISEKYSDEEVENTIQVTIDTMSNYIQKQIFTSMVNLVQDSTITTYNELLGGLNALKDSAIENLTCYEKTSTLIALKVCINSAKMWLPTEIGGEGYYDFIISSMDRTSSYQGRGFWSSLGKIICSDAIGAFSGFVRGALPYFASGGPFNPVSNGAIATQAVIGGATSSATTAVGQAGGH